MGQPKSAERVVRDIQRKTRRRFSAEDAAAIFSGGEDSDHPGGTARQEIIASLCRREGLNPNLYYRWSKEFLEASKRISRCPPV